ncbi:MAG: hypothetical protein WAW10_10990 [Gallionella sp.]
MRTIFAPLALAMMFTPAVAVSQQDSELAAKTSVVLPPGHVPITAMPASIPLTRKGTVLEVLDSPAYTYLRVTGDKVPIWLAAYKIDIAKGAIVNYSDGAAMSNFHSKSLNRTFDAIVFVDRIVQEKK